MRNIVDFYFMYIPPRSVHAARASRQFEIQSKKMSRTADMMVCPRISRVQSHFWRVIATRAGKRTQREMHSLPSLTKPRKKPSGIRRRGEVAAVLSRAHYVAGNSVKNKQRLPVHWMWCCSARSARPIKLSSSPGAADYFQTVAASRTRVSINIRRRWLFYCSRRVQNEEGST